MPERLYGVGMSTRCRVRFTCAALALVLVCLQATTAAAAPTGTTTARGPGAVSYDISLRTGAGARWRGTESVTFTNTGAIPLHRIWLRLWGNGLSGCIAPLAVRVSGVRGGGAGGLAVGCTALPVTLTRTLRPGERGTVSIDLAIDVPRRDDRFGRTGAYATLGNALPILAVRDAGGWRLDPYSATGESFYSLAADWRLRLVHSSAVTVPVTGSSTSRRLAGGLVATTVVARRVRDVAFAAGPYAVSRTTAPTGVVIRAWRPSEVSSAEARDVLRKAGAVMAFYDKRFGRYPYPQLDIVLSRYRGGTFSGMEYPTLTLVSLDRQGVGPVEHELAHQWWYGLVGDDEYAAPWLDESFAQYASYEFMRDPASFCDPTFWPAPDARVTSSMDYFDHHPGYGFTIYGNGLCALKDLQRTIGTSRMKRLMHDYAVTHRYGVSTTERFVAAAQRVSPVDLDPLWCRWRIDH